MPESPPESRTTRNSYHSYESLPASKDGQSHASTLNVITGSGKKAREQFDDMMDAASKHQFDCVLFWKLDKILTRGRA